MPGSGPESFERGWQSAAPIAYAAHPSSAVPWNPILIPVRRLHLTRVARLWLWQLLDLGCLRQSRADCVSRVLHFAAQRVHRHHRIHVCAGTGPKPRTSKLLLTKNSMACAKCTELLEPLAALPVVADVRDITMLFRRPATL